MKREVNVVIAHRYRLLGESLRTALEGTPRLKVTAVVASGGETLQLKGNVYVPHQLQQKIMEKYVFLEDAEDPEKALSNREFQVMKMLALGKSNQEISTNLFIGVKTVDTHRANLLKKLGLRNNADVARFAIRHGFIRA